MEGNINYLRWLSKQTPHLRHNETKPLYQFQDKVHITFFSESNSVTDLRDMLPTLNPRTAELTMFLLWFMSLQLFFQLLVFIAGLYSNTMEIKHKLPSLDYLGMAHCLNLKLWFIFFIIFRIILIVRKIFL